jgi:PAS domain S-box-containing protein
MPYQLAPVNLMSMRLKLGSLGSPAAAIATFCVILVAVVWITTLQRIGFERAEAVRDGTGDLSKLAIAYEEHSLRTLRDVDQVLSIVKGEYERRGPKVDIRQVVETGRFDPALFLYIGIVDKHGILVQGIAAAPRIDLSDREYFRAQVERDTGLVFIGQPALGRGTGKWAIYISRRLNGPDGSFDGVVYMAVDPAYFARFYRRIDLGPDGVVSLVGLDAVARVRQVGDETTFGQDMRDTVLFQELPKATAGTFTSTGKFDGVPRLYSYRVLEDYPIIVTLGTAMSAVMKQSEDRRRIYYAAAFLLSFFIASGGMAVVWLLARRNHALRELKESEHRFRALAEQNISGIYVLQDGVVKYVNPRCAEIGGYTPQEVIGRPILEFIPEQLREGLSKKIEERTSGRTKTAQYTFTARRKDGSSVDVGIHARQAIVDGKPAIIGVMQDIGERKVAEETAKRYLMQLETALVGSIEALRTMVELRDPYTAGHQRRVGDIAAAIGEELKLTDEQVKGLRFSGYVHDIGKISIPAEILSKPGRLTSHEFELIKTHAQQGYDVLKGIEFPWPIARAILEHHERIDGSGYPRGLKGEQISLEARILAVADTVEAMSSHRPYRAALGLDAAMREIQEQSGKRYDERVVAACLRLLRAGSIEMAA